MYEEISIVAGKDIAKGNFSKSFVDIDSTSSGQPSNTEMEPTKSDSATSSEPRRKKSRIEDEKGDLEVISTQLGEVVNAIRKFANNQLDVENWLYKEIMKMEDFEEGIRLAAFDPLIEREMLAKAFLTKSEPLQKIWIQNFTKSLAS